MNRLVEALNKKSETGVGNEEKREIEPPFTKRKVKIKSLYRRNRQEVKKDKYPFKNYYCKPDLIEDSDIPIIRKSDSSSSIDKIEKELSYFVMEKKRGVFSLFRRSKSTSRLKSDESDQNSSKKNITKEDEVRYAKNHIQKFNKIKNRFENEPLETNNEAKRDSKTLILQDIRDNLERQVETQNETKHSSRSPQRRENMDAIDSSVRIRNKPLPNPKPIYTENNVQKLVSSPKLKIPSNRVIEPLRPKTPTKNYNRMTSNEDIQIQKKPVAKTRSLNYNPQERLVFNYDQQALANMQQNSPLPYAPNSPANKNHMKKSVEAFYWRELRKMQEEELNRELEYNRRIYGYLNARTNSMSPITPRSTTQYYPEETYSPIYEDLPHSKPIVRRSSLMETPLEVQYSRPGSSSNPRYMLVPIKQNEVYYSDDEYSRPFIQQRPRIRRPIPQNVNQQTYFHPVNPQNSVRRSYTPSISGASSIYDYPGNVQQQVRLGYGQPQNKNVIQYTPNGVYGTVQHNPQFVRNARFTSSMSNIQHYPRSSQNPAGYGRLV